jgi:hypothetical protein
MDSSREEFVRMESLNITDSSAVSCQDKEHDTVPDEYDPRQERKIKMKLDFTILPFLISIQFLSQMVRSERSNSSGQKLTIKAGQIRPWKCQSCWNDR